MVLVNTTMEGSCAEEEVNSNSTTQPQSELLTTTCPSNDNIEESDNPTTTTTITPPPNMGNPSLTAIAGLNADGATTESSADSSTEHTAEADADTLASLERNSHQNSSKTDLLVTPPTKESNLVTAPSVESAGNYSNCSSAGDVTAKTGLETVDSSNSNNMASVPTPDSVVDKLGYEDVETEASSSNTEPPSGCLKGHAQAIHRKWAAITKRARGWMLQGVVSTSIVAARNPYTTIVSVILLSIGLIVAGYFTNFEIELDNSTLFTPTTSEVIEYGAYVGNFFMYEPESKPGSQRRQRQRRRTTQLSLLKQLEQELQQKEQSSERERDLVTISIFDEGMDIAAYNGSHSTIVIDDIDTYADDTETIDNDDEFGAAPPSFDDDAAAFGDETTVSPSFAPYQQDPLEVGQELLHINSNNNNNNNATESPTPEATGEAEPTEQEEQSAATVVQPTQAPSGISLLYDCRGWKFLPQEVRDAANTLGYGRRRWNRCLPPTLVIEKDPSWDELTPEQQEAASVLGYTEDTWWYMRAQYAHLLPDSVSPTQSPTPEPPVSLPYADKGWNGLPTEVKDAAITLGYTKSRWNQRIPPTLVEEEDPSWEELTPEQQQAASVLGYTKDTWWYMREQYAHLLPEATDNTEPPTSVPTTATEVAVLSSDDNQEAEEKEEPNDNTNIQNKRGRGYIFPILVHADTQNVFTVEGVSRVFDVLDHVRALPEYHTACNGSERSFRNYYGENTCEIKAITRFWHHNRTLFEEQIKTNEDLFEAANKVFYPDGGYVDLPFVLAQMEEDEHGRPVEGQAFYGWIYIKKQFVYDDLTDHLWKLKSAWDKEENPYYVLEFSAPNSLETEAMRAITEDLPLIPTVFVVMCIFTCLVFFRCHRVQSRSLLGFGAVVTILMSIMSGYGLMFIIGIPMTVMTNLLVFVIFGIGLDDTFIITGAYFRTADGMDPVQRVKRTMEAVGSSILLTTITTTTAFCLGSTSTIEPIRWLCFYAFPAIIIDFFYQITFFIAILVLDQRRIQQNRMDCCICFRVPRDEEAEGNEGPGEERQCIESPPQLAVGQSSGLKKQVSIRETTGHGEEKDQLDHFADRFMRWFATRLMNPVVKLVVMLVFVSFACLCAYRTTLLKQEFNFADLLPKDSFASSYVTEVEYYSDRAIALRVVFRFVDQSDPQVRAQMEKYVEDLVEHVDALNEKAPFCWVRELRNAVAADPELQELDFYDQLDVLLRNPAVSDVVGSKIKYRADGTILASECTLFVTDLDMTDVGAQIDFIRQQREVADMQPINHGRELNAFFAYDLLLHMFAFYEVAAGELAATTISSVVAVTIITFLLIPHWTAVPIVLPLISVLYIEMLGVLEIFGFSINVITYVILVLSIGLLVDFIMHILLRYYESECETREEKVKDALGTMGASILVGGLSTFLGVTPLIFSTSEIFSTVCMAFLAMVTLGVSHGLIVLPVILSYCGTETVVRHRKRLSLIQIRTALSERFNQSMDLSNRN